jgi:hypothetical protein
VLLSQPLLFSYTSSGGCEADKGEQNKMALSIEAETEYTELMEAISLPFLHGFCSVSSLAALKQAVIEAQRDFLLWHPNLVAAHDVTITNDGCGRIDIIAPICTAAEKWQLDYDTKERERLIAELTEQSRLEDERQSRRYTHMLKQHRKLMRRCGDRISPSTRGIWHSLDTAQQYAILKDIDYSRRHR